MPAGQKSNNVNRLFASGILLRQTAANQRDGAQRHQTDFLSNVHPGEAAVAGQPMELDGSITRFRRSSVRIMTEPRLILRGAGDTPIARFACLISFSKRESNQRNGNPIAKCALPGCESARRPDADRRRVHLRKLAKSSRYPVFAGR